MALLIGYLIIGVGTTGFLIVLDAFTYPSYSLSKLFLLANIFLWPFTVLSLLAVFLDGGE